MSQKYSGEHLKEISFPLGGIGTGSVGLAGNGRFVDWQIANKPNVMSTNGFTHIAVKAERDGKVLDARVLQGDFMPSYMGGETSGLYGNNGFGQGVDRTTMAGVPHFEENDFEGSFPTATLNFKQHTFPAKVKLTAFNPMIPSNSFDSSLPAAFFEIEIENNTDAATDYTVAFSLNNMAAPTAQNRFFENGSVKGIFLDSVDTDKEMPEYGNLSIATDSDDISYQENWFRGAWFDSLTVYWKDFIKAGKFKNRRYEEKSKTQYRDRMRGEDMCTIAAHIKAEPNEKKTVRFILSWSFPNYCNDWNPIKDKSVKENTWKNYYATVFNTSANTAEYALKNYNRLKRDTLLFSDAMQKNTMPEKVKEAVVNTLSVLHSPTCLRLTDGSFYAWEGCNPFAGSCEGSCTHVWNYNYALPMLFPDLERSMHDVHFTYDMKDSGSLSFRTMLPLGREPWDMRACADGQFGDIINVYREWKISGDTAWLKKWWPTVKKALEFAWSEKNEDRWDDKKQGVLTGRQHHTLDMELFGPSSWLNGMYLAALKASEQMAYAMGEDAKAQEYAEIFKKGSKWVEENLFNGEYYCQKVDIENFDMLKSFGEDAVESYWNAEAGQLKYQIASGCSIDQLLGQWHANLCGLGDIFDSENRKTALKNLYKNNFKESFRDFFNGCRNYALNDEGGLVICTWPENVECPVIPITYSDEVMTGFEYAASSLMLCEGMENEAVSCVNAIRDRYDGKKRNPFNEIECGSYYARAMASYAFLLAYSGFSCDMTEGKLSFNPIKGGECSFFWSVDGAWGTFKRSENKVELDVLYGNIDLNKLCLPFVKGVSEVSLNGNNGEFKFTDGTVVINAKLKAGDSVEIKGEIL